jgi:hypothetical protein
MGILALFPGLDAAFLALVRSPAVAFLNVYIPVLLLCPDYYRYKIMAGLPEISFTQAAILPITAVMLVRGIRWRWSLADFLVFGFAFWLGFSEYLNAGYKEAQNLMFDMATSVLLPYLCAKALVEPLGLRVAFARRMVWLVFLVSIVSIYEFRMGVTLFRLPFDRFFPGQGVGWGTTFRWGFARIAGPYSHAILAGIVLLASWRLARWLEWSGPWESRLSTWRFLPVTKGRIVSLGLLGGLLMTMARGPWIGAFLAAVIATIGRSRMRKQAFRVIAAGILLVGIPAGIALYRYAAVGRAGAKNPAQETAAYRKELIDKYIAIVVRHSVWGWGRSTWPKVPGMPSIDNYYLLLALMHGLPAVAFFMSIMAAMTIRLMAAGMRQLPPIRPGSSLAFTLAGIYVGIAFAVATVYMGKQVIPLFAMLTGWSEGFLLADRKDLTAVRERPSGALRVPVFRRVLA